MSQLAPPKSGDFPYQCRWVFGGAAGPRGVAQAAPRSGAIQKIHHQGPGMNQVRIRDRKISGDAELLIERLLLQASIENDRNCASAGQFLHLQTGRPEEELQSQNAHVIELGQQR